ncbi:MAG: ATP-dependent Clp protease proteolytic subunit [Actinobacteria bacterium]|nr:ATP-dependent Clp protease proteolytic subunit [Actinomycetota bacterium]
MIGPGDPPPHPGEHDRPSLAQLTYGALFDRRIVFLRGEIKDGLADDVAAQLLALDARAVEDVTLMIDSPGGEVTGLFVVHDTIQTLDSTVHTRCLGLAASGAAVVLATGTGRRQATANSRILLHQPHGGVQGSAIDVEIQAREFLHLRRRIDEILAERTGQPVERIREDTDRDRWFSAEEALAYGLIDEVLPERAARLRPV